MLTEGFQSIKMRMHAFLTYVMPNPFFIHGVRTVRTLNGLFKVARNDRNSIFLSKNEPKTVISVTSTYFYFLVYIKLIANRNSYVTKIKTKKS